MRLPVSTRRSDSDNTMTPMIDVVFQLLIFFVCAAALQVHEALLPADLPVGGVAGAERVEPEERPDRAWIQLARRDGATIPILNQVELPELPQLQDQLRALAELAPETVIVLDVEPEVPFEDAIAVFDLCREVQFTDVNFALDVPRE